MNKIRSTGYLLVLALGVTSALAAEPGLGVYLGGSLGMATTSVSSSGAIGKLDATDKNDQSYLLRAGYRFHRNLAVEAV